MVAVSPLYETEPVGGPAGQGLYLNVVVELSTEDTPRRLLERCRALEAAAGRVRAEHWGPRTLDADVLLVEGTEVHDPDLAVPHPRLWERPFVLAPLSELAPDLVAPGWERRFVVQPLADLAPDLVSSSQLEAAGGRVERVGRL